LSAERLQTALHVCGGQHSCSGVSVHNLKTSLLDAVYDAGLDKGATLYEVETCVLKSLGSSIRCPRDSRMGAAYVDTLHGEDHSGAATHLLSCCKGTSVGDVVGALDRYCREAGLSPKRTYVWHNSLCMNHRPRRTSRSGRSGCSVCHGDKVEDSFVDDLTCRVKSIGKVLAVVAPWEGPQYLTDAGCIAELFLADSLGCGGCELNVLAAPEDAARLAADLLDGGHGLVPAWQALSSLQVEDSSGDVHDNDSILRFIREGPGAAQVNASVARRLHLWLAEEAEGQVRRLVAAGELDGHPAARVCDAVGWMLREVSLHDRATAMMQDGLQLALRAGALGNDVPPRSTLLSSVGASRGLRSGGGPDAGTLRATEDAARLEHERTGTLETPAGLALLSSIGATKWMAGDSAGALEALLEAKRVRHDMGTLETLDGAVLLRNIGIVKWARGDQDGGLDAYAEARAMYEKTGSLNTCGGVGLLLNIGFAKADCDDTAGSLEAYEKAREIFEAHGSLEMPSGATLLSSIGVARGNQGDQAGALAVYQQARCIRERTGTMGSFAGAVLLRNTGVSHAAADDQAAALEAYAEAWQVREGLGAQEALAGADLLSITAKTKAEMGDREGALEVCRDAKRIYECTGTLGSQGGEALARMLNDLEEEQATKELSACWV